MTHVNWIKKKRCSNVYANKITQKPKKKETKPLPVTQTHKEFYNNL